MNGGLARLGYYARTTFHGLRASPVTSGVAIVTIGISLVLVGAFALLVANMEELIDQFGDDLHVTAYLSPGLNEQARLELVKIVETVEGVESVRVVSEDEALERFEACKGNAEGDADQSQKNRAEHVPQAA